MALLEELKIVIEGDRHLNSIKKSRTIDGSSAKEKE